MQFHINFLFIIWRKVTIYTNIQRKITRSKDWMNVNHRPLVLCSNAEKLVPCQKNWAHRWHLKTPPSMEFSSHSIALIKIWSLGASWSLNGLIIWHKSCFIINAVFNSVYRLSINEIKPKIKQSITNKTTWKLLKLKIKVGLGCMMCNMFSSTLRFSHSFMTILISQEKLGDEEMITSALLLSLEDWARGRCLILNSDQS